MFGLVRRRNAGDTIEHEERAIDKGNHLDWWRLEERRPDPVFGRTSAISIRTVTPVYVQQNHEQRKQETMVAPFLFF